MSAEAAELIRAHARHPVGRDETAPTEVLGRAELLTPTCGDRIEVRVSGDATALAISWSGRGCEVSQGSASLLADELDGLDAVTARGRVTAFLDAMAAHPILINRPLVVSPLGVKLCRPSEEVFDLLPPDRRAPFTKEDGEVVVPRA